MPHQIKAELVLTYWDSDSVKQKPKVFSKTVTLDEFTGFKTFDLAASTTITFWDPVNVTSEQFTAFDFLFIKSDQQVDVELTSNEGDANEELHTVRIPAGGWFLLLSNAAYFNFTTDAFAGTVDVFDKVRLKSGSSACKIIWAMGDDT